MEGMKGMPSGGPEVWAKILDEKQTASGLGTTSPHSAKHRTIPYIPFHL